jgi:hypothetical protein
MCFINLRLNNLNLRSLLWYVVNNNPFCIHIDAVPLTTKLYFVNYELVK